MIDAGGLRLRWTELDPSIIATSDEWSHPGLAPTAEGGVIAFDQTTKQLVELDRADHVIRRAEVPALCGHAMALGVSREGDRVTWLADPGRRWRLMEDGSIDRRESPGRVLRVDDAGRPSATALEAPRHPVYEGSPFRPSGIVLERPTDPLSPVWVADGYGASAVLRYRAGEPDVLMVGPPGARFDTPHTVAIDPRGNEPTLIVADRGNATVHRFDLDGRHIATFGVGVLTSPSAFAFVGDLLIVGELHGRLVLFDAHDRLVGLIGDGSAAFGEPGWPNREHGGRTTAREPTPPGVFIAPHALIVRTDGRILVAEWRIGGRLVQLVPV